jgi:glyoxylase-like metal-dependent hydrolase (beta-lactamase superfamily II)
MRKVAGDVWQLCGFPPNVINAYRVGEVLIDAATRWARGRILAELHRRPVRLVALTHCHPDHQGAARAVCERFGVPLACHEADVPFMEGREPMVPRIGLVRFAQRFWAGPPYPVTRVLHDGDVVAGLRVIHSPGHTPGHIFYLREADRLVIAGDVLANIHFLTGKVGLRVPPRAFSTDPARNRESIRLLAALQPSIVCFGHGPPLYDPSILDEFVRRLP